MHIRHYQKSKQNYNTLKALSLEKKAMSSTYICTFELGKESGEGIPSWSIVGFMYNDENGSQTQDKSVLDRLRVSTAVFRRASCH